MQVRRLLAGVSLCVWLAVLLVGCSAKGITISDLWARPGVQGGASAVYFTLNNGSSQADSLTSVESPAAGMVQIHRSSIDASGTMQMEEQDQVELPAGEEVRFEPGGLHVMLMDLPADLDPGDAISVTLTFQNRDPLTLEVTVREP